MIPQDASRKLLVCLDVLKKQRGKQGEQVQEWALYGLCWQEQWQEHQPHQQQQRQQEREQQ